MRKGRVLTMRFIYEFIVRGNKEKKKSPDISFRICGKLKKIFSTRQKYLVGLTKCLVKYKRSLEI